MVFTVILLLLITIPMPAIVCWRAGEWCLNRQLRFLVYLVLFVSGIGIAYGLLRLTGAVILPDDNTWSVNWFDASWRDDGVRFLILYGVPFTGTAAALVLDRKKGDASSASRPDFQIEEKM